MRETFSQFKDWHADVADLEARLAVVTRAAGAAPEIETVREALQRALVDLAMLVSREDADAGAPPRLAAAREPSGGTPTADRS